MRTKSRQNRDTNLVQQGEKLECYLCAKLPRPPFNEFPRNPVCAKSFGGKLKSMTILFLIDQKNPLLFSLSHVSYQPYFIAFFKNRLLSSMYNTLSHQFDIRGLWFESQLWQKKFRLHLSACKLLFRKAENKDIRLEWAGF